MPQDDWSMVATFGDRISAQALVGLLDSEKLLCRLVSNEPLPGLGTRVRGAGADGTAAPAHMDPRARAHVSNRS